MSDDFRAFQYLKPIYGATVNQSREFPDSISESVADGRHCDNNM